VKPRKGKREASLVLEFDNPCDANQAIDQGTIWNHQAHANTVYVKEARSKLCNKCQKPGHVQVQCPSKEFTCGTCAARHPTWECPSQRGSEGTLKCANCNGGHKSVSLTCPVWKVAIEQAKVALASARRYHRVPAYLQRGHAQVQSRPQEESTDSGNTTSIQQAEVPRMTTTAAAITPAVVSTQTPTPLIVFGSAKRNKAKPTPVNGPKNRRG
jgi:hypothetical protein